jgi:hypothetical protein
MHSLALDVTFHVKACLAIDTVALTFTVNQPSPINVLTMKSGQHELINTYAALPNNVLNGWQTFRKRK